MSKNDDGENLNFVTFHEWSLSNVLKNNGDGQKESGVVYDEKNIPNVSYHSLKCSDKCLYVWIGDNGNRLENLSCSMQTPYEKEPLGVEIIQSNKQEQQNSIFGNLSRDLAIKLAKKLNKQVFVSFNVSINLLELVPPSVEPITTLEESYHLNGSHDLIDSPGASPAQSLLTLIEKSLFKEIKSHPDKF